MSGDNTIQLKPGIPGVTRDKPLQHPVRVIGHETQEFKIIASKALRDAERRERARP